MLSAVKVDSPREGIPQLVFNLINRPETDLFVCRNIEGLDPVKADVNTTSLVGDGESSTGNRIGKRNIVFTIAFNPNWENWTLSKLRKELSKYFMPKMNVRLIFESNEMSPVAISGIVESNEYNMFSKDPENQISIICPEPYFETATPIELTGTTQPGVSPFSQALVYNGDVETGVYFKITSDAVGLSSIIAILVGLVPQEVEYFGVNATIDNTTYFEVNSIPGKKYIRLVDVSTGDPIDNLLDNFYGDSKWDALILKPDVDHFITISTYLDERVHWLLSYTEKFGGL